MGARGKKTGSELVRLCRSEGLPFVAVILMVLTKAKRLIVIALVAGVGFVIGLMMVPPPNQAEAACTKRGYQCMLENLQHVGSDAAAEMIRRACRELYS